MSGKPATIKIKEIQIHQVQKDQILSYQVPIGVNWTRQDWIRGQRTIEDLLLD